MNFRRITRKHCRNQGKANLSDLLNGRLKDRDALEKKMNQVNLKIEKYLVIYGKLSGETQLDMNPGLLDFYYL